MEKLIFPYERKLDLFGSENMFHLIKEDKMAKAYPLAYQYLEDQQLILSQRDKGKREYEAWYAYGRNQAININGFKLLFPYISDKPYFVYSNQKELLFYNGYALVSNNEEDLLVVQKILNSKLFWYYIEHTSKPYGSRYYALAKNYVKHFGVYQLNEEQKTHLMSLKNSDDIDKYLIEIYGISF